MKKLLLLALSCSCLTMHAQSSKVKKTETRKVVEISKQPIPKVIMKEFASHAYYTFRYARTSFPIIIRMHFENLGYSLPDIGVVMENLADSPKEFDEVLKAIWNHSAKYRDYLYLEFSSFDVSATTATYLTDYCIEKFSSN